MNHWKSAAVAVAVACGLVPGAAVAQTKPAIDVCAIVTPAKAKAILGDLPMQPPATTDNGGFGLNSCMYVGPKVSGAGAQTIFLRLTVETGTDKNKDGVEILQDNADKRKATTSLGGVGESAKRNQAGTYVWARQRGIVCAAEIANGLPKGLTADATATALGGLCREIFANVKK